LVGFGAMGRVHDQTRPDAGRTAHPGGLGGR
jgi:hypothetical protein